MRVFTVHLRRTADPLFTPDLGAEFVREGFNKWALLFTWIWALSAGLWIPAAILFAAEIALALALEAVGLDVRGQLVASTGWHVMVGFMAEDLRRWSLRLRGFALADVVAAESLAAAERRYFEHNPAMAKPAWR